MLGHKYICVLGRSFVRLGVLPVVSGPGIDCAEAGEVGSPCDGVWTDSIGLGDGGIGHRRLGPQRALGYIWRNIMFVCGLRPRSISQTI